MKATQVSKENGVVKFNIEFSAEEFKGISQTEANSRSTDSAKAKHQERS